MTNKPMLSVERELLADFLEYPDNGGWYDGVWITHKEKLRALLDEPDEPFNLQGWSIDHSAGRPILMHNKCSVIEAEQAYGLLNLIESADQPRVDPVAEVYRGPVSGINRIRWVNSRTQPVGAKLYAEQTEPVADHTQCEECKGWGYHENHHEGGGTECGECGGSGNATVAATVVMPERKPMHGSHAQGYNEELDEVARLNGVKT